jgi:hypothetical protein
VSSTGANRSASVDSRFPSSGAAASGRRGPVRAASAKHLGPDQPPHFARHAGEHDDFPQLAGEPEARGGAARIGEHQGAARHFRLTAIAFGELAAQPREARDDRVPDFRVELERRPKSSATTFLERSSLVGPQPPVG